MKIRNTYFFLQRLQKISSAFLKVIVLLVATFFIKLLSQTYVQAKVEVTFSKNQTEQIFALIERYIDNNPEIVLRALEKVQNKESQGFCMIRTRIRCFFSEITELIIMLVAKSYKLNNNLAYFNLI